MADAVCSIGRVGRNDLIRRMWHVCSRYVLVVALGLSQEPHLASSASALPAPSPSLMRELQPDARLPLASSPGMNPGVAPDRFTAALLPDPNARSSPLGDIVAGELNEYPDIAYDSRGVRYVVWVGFPDGQENVFVQIAPPSEVGDAPTSLQRTIRLGAGSRSVGWPRIVVHHRSAWITWAEWSASDAGNAPLYEIRLAHLIREKLVSVTTISDSPYSCLRPAITLDSHHVPWIAWEEMRADHSAVVCRRGVALHKSPIQIVDESGELNLRPALVGLPQGGVAVAWDHYEQRRYDIRLRVVNGNMAQPMQQITQDGWLDQAPALLPDQHGQLFIAWHSDRPLAGAAQPRLGRTILVAILDDKGLSMPIAGSVPPLAAVDGRPEIEDCLEFANLAWDSAGALIVTARRGQGFVAFRLTGSRWSPPIDLSEAGWGGRGRDLRVARSPDGVLHFVARWLHRIGVRSLSPVRSPASPIQSQLIAMPLPANTEPCPEPPSALAPPLTPAIVPELEHSAQSLTEPAGREAPPPLYFGDLHTHSWMSDGTGDPDEVFVRARDVLDHDFVVLTDHDVLNGNRLAPFEWNYIQLLSNFFNQPGSFVTLIGYEWTSMPVDQGGAGHRNVYFPKDRAPLFSVAREAPSSRELFDLLRPLGAFVIPHHTSWTGTVWEDADPILQPLFEVISTHGNSELPVGQPIRPRAGPAATYARDGFAHGRFFGFVGGSDGHGVPWHYGISRKADIWTTGVTGVYAPSLQRPAIFDALLRRHCFATSGPKVQLAFELENRPMGSQLTLGPDASATIRLSVKAPTALASVVLVRDGEVVREFECGRASLHCEEKVQLEPPVQAGVWYLRIVLQDGNMAWSSPIGINLPTSR